MDIKVPPRINSTPRYYTETYPGMEKDIADDIFSAIYWKRKDELDARGKTQSDKEGVEQSLLIANAILDAVPQVVELESACDRAKIRLLMQIEKNKTYFLAKQEYQSLEEYLNDRLIFSENKGEISQLVFLTTQYIPMLERIDPTLVDQLLSMKDNWTRARETIGYLRTQTSIFLNATNQIQDEIQRVSKAKQKLEFRKDFSDPKEKEEIEEAIEEKREVLEKLEVKKTEVEKQAVAGIVDCTMKAMSVIADTSIPTGGPAGINRVLRKGIDASDLVIKAEKYLYPHGTGYYLVAPNGYARAVESSLSQFVDFTISDPDLLFRHFLNSGNTPQGRIDQVTGLKMVVVAPIEFKWLCPTCNTTNRVLTVDDVVCCSQCGSSFTASVKGE